MLPAPTPSDTLLVDIDPYDDPNRAHRCRGERRPLLDAFDDHDPVAFTHSDHENIDSEPLDVTDADEVAGKLEGFDIVIHLAGASSPDADWEIVSETNIQGTKHVYDAAVENGIDRVVFASSNHAVGRYNSDGADPGAERFARATWLSPATAGTSTARRPPPTCSRTR